jgi:hypothetical protein
VLVLNGNDKARNFPTTYEKHAAVQGAQFRGKYTFKNFGKKIDAE